MRLTGHVRSLDTLCVQSEAADRDAVKTLIYEQVPSGFEVFAIGYTPLDSTVRACAILWSTAVRVYSAAGEDFDSAYAAIADQVPANRRHAIQVMQEA